MEIFDNVNTPELKIIDAIRMAISIPFVFSIKKYNENIYVDGAIINNFPINLFKSTMDTTLCIKLKGEEMDRESGCNDNKDNDICNLKEYVLRLIKCMVHNKEDTNDNILIIDKLQASNDKGLFYLNTTQKLYYIHRGYHCADKYFALGQ